MTMASSGLAPLGEPPPDSDSEEGMFEELLLDRGPLIAPIPNSLEMKQLENVIRHLHGQIKLNSNAIKRQRKAKKASVVAQRKATIAQNMAGLPGGSRPGTPGQPAVVVKSASSEMAEKWSEVDKVEEGEGNDEKEEVRMWEKLEGCGKQYINQLLIASLTASLTTSLTASLITSF